ncbi:MAG: dephospho-CoA kinase [Caldimicrobium sp.]
MIKKIAITGGIATGKSTLLNLIKKLGFPTLSCDEVVHNLYSSMKVQEDIIKLGGPELYNPLTQSLDKEALLKKMIQEPLFKKKLEQLIHPLVWKEIEKFFVTHEKKGYKVAFVEVPLLYEVGWEIFFDEVWIVVASLETQERRLREKKNYQFLVKLRDNQLPLEEKIKKAHRIFSSEKPVTILEEELKDILREYQ